GSGGVKHQVRGLDQIFRSPNLPNEPCIPHDPLISRGRWYFRICDSVLAIGRPDSVINRTSKANQFNIHCARVTIKGPLLSTRYRTGNNRPLTRHCGRQVRCSTSHIINRCRQLFIRRANSDNFKMRPIVSSLIRVLKRSIPRHLHNRTIHMGRKSRRDKWDRAINMPYGVRPIILTTHNGGNIPVPILEREIPTILNRREISLSTTPTNNLTFKAGKVRSKFLNRPIRLRHVPYTFFNVNVRVSSSQFHFSATTRHHMCIFLTHDSGVVTRISSPNPQVLNSALGCWHTVISVMSGSPARFFNSAAAAFSAPALDRCDLSARTTARRSRSVFCVAVPLRI